MSRQGNVKSHTVTNTSKKNLFLTLIWYILFAGLFALYGLLIWQNFSRIVSTISEHFGYLDTQENWQALNDFTKGKVYFRDYFYEYGWFLLFLESIPYLILQKTYMGVIVARHLFLPILGVILAYFVGKIILKKKHLILLFLLLNLFYGATTDFSPVRYLVAELSLAFVFLSFIKPRKWLFFLTGITAGLALLTALEYGIALNITLFFLFLLNLSPFFKEKKVSWLTIFLGELFILFPFSIYLMVNSAFGNYVNYTLSIMNKFYYSSPCARSGFPRFSDIPILRLQSSWLILNTPIEFLQNLNMYIVFFFYIIIFLLIMFRLFQKRSIDNYFLIRIGLITFGGLVFIRTLDTPCIGYFRYGIIPFFLLLTLYFGELIEVFKKTKKLGTRFVFLIFICLTILWFIITDNTGFVASFFVKKNNPTVKEKLSGKIFYKPAGWYFDKKKAEMYEEIAQYIFKNTRRTDSLLVYPWGPYNNITGLDSSNSVQFFNLPLQGQKIYERVIKEFDIKKPKFVVINIFNTLSTALYGKKRTDVRYFSNPNEDGPVFVGDGDEIQRYILEHYTTVFKNNLAIIMERRKKSIKIKGLYKKVAAFDITGKSKSTNGTWELHLDRPIKTTDIKVEAKVDGDIITKRLSRFLIKEYVATDENVTMLISNEIVRKEWQTLRMSLDQLRNVASIKLVIGENMGIAWWLKPYSLKVGKVTFYQWLPLSP